MAGARSRLCLFAALFSLLLIAPVEWTHGVEQDEAAAVEECPLTVSIYLIRSWSFIQSAFPVANRCVNEALLE